MDTILLDEPLDNECYLHRQEQFESKVRSYPRKLPFAIQSAKGAWITDVEGNEYIDCLSGAGTLALGHNHPVVTESIKALLDSNLPMHTLDITTPLKDKFSEFMYKLLATNSDEYCLQFCGPTGADAVEAAIKLAKQVTGRSGVVSFSGGYHGMTHGALAVTGNLAPKQGIEGLMNSVQFLPYPNMYRCAFGLPFEQSIHAHMRYFENFLKDVESGVVKPAAVILEVIQGEGGVNPAPIEWLKHVRRVTKELGIMLIIDEVQTGFCRTGRWFAYQYADIDPDMIVMSKAIGGGLPLAVLGIKKQYDVWQAGNHSGTFRGNQLAMATGLATLNYLKDNNVADYVLEIGAWFMAQLKIRQQRYPKMGQVRGRGLMIGIEIINPSLPKQNDGSYPADSDVAAKIQQACFKHGLVIEKGGRGGTVLRLLPPLNITKDELQQVLQRLDMALEDNQ
ncbi:diaminobutyrate--2-oxoglutarate transaminase family protein [Psychrobacter sp. NG254]|uniref:diaminobutyrate--2-oxoglutarate transaminase family protein n=1 Tax=Psychrobacter sp. NG254 TaxID=2782003 RepID=UPI001887C45A|nr:diaminobutyrate--2-oxoglutarate transaminase family protein [Psychrobacter sp. NG254]MBF2719975.1 diaminobutyrate--2-oxoglutarate transaminase family protein [Psychrobacter sp. NG254]